jgi:hypothetical protein
MKSPAFLSAMGKMLSAQLGLKSSGNRLVDDALEMWRIPSGRDLESLAQRIASLEERLAAMEGKPAAAKDAAGAAKAEAK